MNMNKAFFLRKEDEKSNWILIDANGKVLGRLASKIVTILRGKNKPEFTPHADAGDYVVVLNAEKVLLSGEKVDNKQYDRYTGWKGGYKLTSVRQILEKDPAKLIELAVRRMLPKSKLGDKLFSKLKVYAGTEHPHQAQNPQSMDIEIRQPSRKIVVN
jgi:large subunit ribosomal protein L13